MDPSSQSTKCSRQHKPYTPDELAQAKHVIIKSVQREFYSGEFTNLDQKKDVPKNSSLTKLNPVLEERFIRVGGRLKHAQLDRDEKNPIILPG